jgi:hypothetical protein
MIYHVWHNKYDGQNVAPITILAGLVCLIGISCNHDLTKDENTSPAIYTLTVNPNVVEINDSSVVICEAGDIDGDFLTYAWSAEAGTIDGVAHIVNWLAPNTAGNYFVLCTVSDGRGGQDTDSVSILVVEPLTGSGTFSTLDSYGVGGFPLSVFAVNFNADGDVDLAIADALIDNISIFVNE